MVARVLVITVVLGMSIPVFSDEIRGKARVVDGDTLVIDGERIRLHGIDAPEMDQHCQEADGTAWPCGEKAKEVLMQMAQGEVSCRWSAVDRYKRKVGTCSSGKLNLNKAMVRKGFALAYTRYSKRYIFDEILARFHDDGMHRGTFTKPWEWRHE